MIQTPKPLKGPHKNATSNLPQLLRMPNLLLAKRTIPHLSRTHKTKSRMSTRHKTIIRHPFKTNLTIIFILVSDFWHFFFGFCNNEGSHFFDAVNQVVLFDCASREETVVAAHDGEEDTGGEGREVGALVDEGAEIG
jgi:hypothetical protein